MDIKTLITKRPNNIFFLSVKYMACDNNAAVQTIIKTNNRCLRYFTSVSLKPKRKYSKPKTKQGNTIKTPEKYIT